MNIGKEIGGRGLEGGEEVEKNRRDVRKKRRIEHKERMRN
jgi:hypothetical protein